MECVCCKFRFWGGYGDSVKILQSQFIERALDTKNVGVADVGIYLCGADAGMAKNLLDQTNVNSIFK